MQNVFSFRDSMIEEYSLFSRSFSKIAAQDLSSTVEAQYAAGRYWPEPLIQINPNYLRKGTLHPLVEQQLLHPCCLDIFQSGKQEGNPQPVNLYAHQLEAIAKAKEKKSYVVTTGTGSGKSLAFFLPIIDQVLRAKQAGEPQRTRAIVIYPMNALANIRFMRMLDMANDSHLFADAASPERLPLYEAKMVHQFDHRWAEYRRDEAGEATTVDVTVADKQNPEYNLTPRYWVAAREVLHRTANLPKGLLQALRDKDDAATLLALTRLLFGQWLLRRGMTTAAQVVARLYPGWQEFSHDFPFAAEIAPASLDLCDDKPLPALLAANPTCLPAEPLATMTQNPDTAWHAASEIKVAGHLEAAKTCHQAIEHKPTLPDAATALAFAEQLLDLASPKWLMGWRDICRATDERTVIASVVPRAATGDTLLLMFPAPKHGRRLAALLADQCSLVHDFAARQKVGGTHLKYHVKKQLPNLPPDHYTEADLDFIVPRVLELTYTSHDLRPWAEDLGYSGPPFGFDPERRAQLRAELDVFYARLYGLTRDELRYILDPADVMGEDYPSETFRVLKNNELRQFGEYRTRRLVLAAWDALEMTYGKS